MKQSMQSSRSRHWPTRVQHVDGPKHLHPINGGPGTPLVACIWTASDCQPQGIQRHAWGAVGFPTSSGDGSFRSSPATT